MLTANDLPDDVTLAELAVSDSKLTFSRNTFSDYVLDCAPTNLSQVDLVSLRPL